MVLLEPHDTVVEDALVDHVWGVKQLAVVHQSSNEFDDYWLTQQQLVGNVFVEVGPNDC